MTDAVVLDSGPLDMISHPSARIEIWPAQRSGDE